MRIEVKVDQQDVFVGEDHQLMTEEQKYMVVFAAKVKNILDIQPGSNVLIKINRLNWVRMWSE